MTATPVASLPALANDLIDDQSPPAQLEALRQLLHDGAQALSTGDALQAEAACSDLTRLAINLQPAFAALFPEHEARKGLGQEERQRLLLPLMEARAFYLAALRRWRRSLRLRQSLLEMQSESSAHGADELSRWC